MIAAGVKIDETCALFGRKIDGRTKARVALVVAIAIELAALGTGDGIKVFVWP